MSHMTHDERSKLTGPVARANPDWSIAQIEDHLNLRPTNFAGAFKKTSPMWTYEQKRFNERLAAWEQRNGRN